MPVTKMTGGVLKLFQASLNGGNLLIRTRAARSAWR